MEAWHVTGSEYSRTYFGFLHYFVREKKIKFEREVMCFPHEIFIHLFFCISDTFIGVCVKGREFEEKKYNFLSVKRIPLHKKGWAPVVYNITDDLK